MLTTFINTHDETSKVRFTIAGGFDRLQSEVFFLLHRCVAIVIKLSSCFFLAMRPSSKSGPGLWIIMARLEGEIDQNFRRKKNSIQVLKKSPKIRLFSSHRHNLLLFSSLLFQWKLRNRSEPASKKPFC